MNSEFQKYFPNTEFIPILRNLETNRYWINENLLKVKVGKTNYNLANVLIEIINEYSKSKQDSFLRFLKACEELQKIEGSNQKKVIDFISSLLAPNVDARLFEIVSFSILKFYYHDQTIFWGFEINKLNKESLKLYKTGRTNANDGGIDFIMRPLGRFFQVTETLDFKKYFLDIDKIQKYPITFVIKSEEKAETLLAQIKANANKIYSVNAIVEKYMDCIEEVINIQKINKCFKIAIKTGYLNNILNEIISQSKVEFNYSDSEDVEQDYN